MQYEHRTPRRTRASLPCALSITTVHGTVAVHRQMRRRTSDAVGHKLPLRKWDLGQPHVCTGPPHVIMLVVFKGCRHHFEKYAPSNREECRSHVTARRRQTYRTCSVPRPLRRTSLQCRAYATHTHTSQCPRRARPNSRLWTRAPTCGTDCSLFGLLIFIAQAGALLTNCFRSQPRLQQHASDLCGCS